MKPKRVVCEPEVDLGRVQAVNHRRGRHGASGRPNYLDIVLIATDALRHGQFRTMLSSLSFDQTGI
jgi:hypothetical protein